MYILGTIAILQFLYIVFSEHMHKKERIDLYNRLMAKDLHDYSLVSKDEKPSSMRNPILRNIEKNKKDLEGYFK